MWLVTGGKNGLTCTGKVHKNGKIECEKIHVPDCVDKTIYCTNPPESIPGATISVSNEGKTGFKIKIFNKLHTYIFHLSEALINRMVNITSSLS